MVEINLMEEVDVGNIPGIDLLMNDKKSTDNKSKEKKIQGQQLMNLN